jgi:hypothetical protein
MDAKAADPTVFHEYAVAPRAVAVVFSLFVMTPLAAIAVLEMEATIENAIDDVHLVGEVHQCSTATVTRHDLLLQIFPAFPNSSSNDLDMPLNVRNTDSL